MNGNGDYDDWVDCVDCVEPEARVWFTNRAGAYGRELTSPGEDCRSPALSPARNMIAMVCTYQKQESFLTIASWNGSSMGPRQNIVTDQLVAQPTWAPAASNLDVYDADVNCTP